MCTAREEAPHLMGIPFFVGDEGDSEYLPSSTSSLNVQAGSVFVALENIDLELLEKNKDMDQIFSRYFSDTELRDLVRRKEEYRSQREKYLIRKCDMWASVKNVPFIPKILMQILLRVALD